MVIDGTEGVTAQDQRLAERVDAAGCPIVVLLNKWELIDDADDRAAKRVEVGRRLAFLGDSPVLPISALTGKGVHKLRPLLTDAVEQYHRRADQRRQSRHRSGSASSTRRRGSQSAVCRAGRYRPSHVHLVRQSRTAPTSCAVSRTQNP